MAAVRQPVDPGVLVAVVDLVARLPRNPEFRAESRHRFAVEQAGDETETLVLHVTLLPGHAPSSGAKCHPCLRNTVLPMSQEGQIPKAVRFFRAVFNVRASDAFSATEGSGGFVDKPFSLARQNSRFVGPTADG